MPKYITFDTVEDANTYRDKVIEINPYLRSPLAETLIQPTQVTGFDVWFCLVTDIINVKAFTFRRTVNYNPETYISSFNKNLVIQNITYFNELLSEWTADNIVAGIDRDGNKSSEVNIFLKDVINFGQVGSLNQTIVLLDFLISEGVPAHLDPYVTDARLTTFRDNIASHIAATSTPII